MNDALVSLSGERAFVEIAGTTHKMAGSAAVFGAVGLRDFLIEIENAANNEDTQLMNIAIDRVSEIWAETKPLLQPE